MNTAADHVQTAVVAIRCGDLATLQRVLVEHPELTRDRPAGLGGRTLLHVVTDWPGRRPRAEETISLLVRLGADVDARYDGTAHQENPLHWAASSNDVEAIHALLDAGADIDAAGGSSEAAHLSTTPPPSGNGTPLTFWWSAGHESQPGTPPPSDSPTGSGMPSPG